MKKHFVFLQIFILAVSLCAAELPGLKIFQQATNFYSGEGNLLLSPFSLRQCGALLYHGASDQSAGELQKALELPQNCGELFSGLRKEFTGQKNIKLIDFNAVFALHPLQQKYLNCIGRKSAMNWI